MPVVAAFALIGWSGLGSVVILWSTSAVIAASCQYAFLTLTSVLAFAVPLGATYLRSRDAGPQTPDAEAEADLGAGAGYVGSN